MTYKVKKSVWDYKQQVVVPSICGGHKAPLYQLVEFVSNTADSFDFIVCLDKISEDWGLTEALGKYAMSEVVKLHVEHGKEDPEWKQETIKLLEGWLE